MVAKIEPSGELIQVQGPMIRLVGLKNTGWFRASQIEVVAEVEGETRVSLIGWDFDHTVLHPVQHVLNALRAAREK